MSCGRCNSTATANADDDLRLLTQHIRAEETGTLQVKYHAGMFEQKVVEAFNWYSRSIEFEHWTKVELLNFPGSTMPQMNLLNLIDIYAFCSERVFVAAWTHPSIPIPPYPTRKAEYHPPATPQRVDGIMVKKWTRQCSNIDQDSQLFFLDAALKVWKPSFFAHTMFSHFMVAQPTAEQTRILYRSEFLAPLKLVTRTAQPGYSN